MIDGVREVCVEVAERVIRQRSQMHHGIETLQIRLCYIANILRDLGEFGNFLPKIASGKQIVVKACDVITGRAKDSACNGTDIAFVTSQQ